MFLNLANLGAKIMKTSQCTKKYAFYVAVSILMLQNFSCFIALLLFCLYLLFTSVIYCHLPAPWHSQLIFYRIPPSFNILLFIVYVNTMAWSRWKLFPINGVIFIIGNILSLRCTNTRRDHFRKHKSAIARESLQG